MHIEQTTLNISKTRISFMRYVFLLLIISLYSAEANAYLDGGTGSMIIQLLLGGFAVAGSFVKIYWNKIKKYFISSKEVHVTSDNINSDPSKSDDKK